MKVVWSFLRKLRIELPYESPNPYSRYLLKIFETYMQKHIFTPMSTAILLMVAKTWTQLKCLLTDNRMNKIWYIYTMEHQIGQWPSSRQAPWDLTQFSQLPSAAPSYFQQSHYQSEISSFSKVILVLGKARSCRAPNLGYGGAESPG